MAKEDVVGREKELEDLENLLQESEKVVVVNGLGGIGKTTLAKCYLAIHKNDYDHIAFIEVSADEAKGQSNFISAVANDLLIHENLGISLNPELNETDRANLIMNGLQQLKGNNLLLIDNATADLPKSGITLPTPPHWKVLVTSRVKLDQFTLFALDSLSMQEGKALFQKYAGQIDEAALEELLTLIDCHTLTIELLAKTYAKSLTMKNVGELVDYLKNKQLGHQRLAKKIISEHANNEEITAYSHLLSAFSLTHLSDREIWLLKQFTVLPPKAMTVKFLFDLLAAKTEDEKEEISDLLQSLHKKGWLQAIEHQAFFIHRMIQTILGYQLDIKFQDCKNLVNGVAELLNLDQTKDNPIDKFPWVAWGEKLLQWFEHSSEPEVSTLMNNLALRYRDLGNYLKAVELLEKVLTSKLPNFQETHPTVALSRSNLGALYLDLGEYGKSVALLEKALSSNLASFGESHHDVTAARSNLAQAYQALGDYQKAAKLLKTALVSTIKNFGEADPWVAIIWTNLGLVYQNLGEYEKSAALLEKALSSNLMHFKETHPTVAISRSNLAGTYRDLGRYEESVELSRIALDLDLSNFGEAHSIVVKRRHNLAMAYRDLGWYKESMELFQIALSSGLKCFGEAHPIVAEIRSGLALVYKTLGRYEESLELLENALSSDLEIFGEVHPNVALRKLNLGAVYIDLQQYQRAQDLIYNAYKLYLNLFGAEHPYTKKAKSWLDKVKGLLR